MAFLSILITILEGAFIVGVLGSALVLILTTVEDIEVMLPENDHQHSPE